MIKRSISTNAMLLNRHPVVRIARKPGAPQFAPQFAPNQIIAKTRLPWVPPRHLKRVQRERRRADMAKAREERLKESSEAVSKFLLSSERVKREESHPDPLVAYKLEVEALRNKYAKEIEKEQKQAAEAEAKEMASKKKEKEAQKAEAKEQSDGSVIKLSRAAMSTMNDIEKLVLKQLKSELMAKKRQAALEQKKEAVEKLYLAAESFITPDSLEQELDRFMRNVSNTVSLPADKLLAIATEQKKIKREMELFDALNGTINMKQPAGVSSKILEQQ